MKLKSSPFISDIIPIRISDSGWLFWPRFLIMNFTCFYFYLIFEEVSSFFWIFQNIWRLPGRFLYFTNNYKKNSSHALPSAEGAWECFASPVFLPLGINRDKSLSCHVPRSISEKHIQHDLVSPLLGGIAFEARYMRTLLTRPHSMKRKTNEVI